ncbi:MAG TPA: hypothetical protein VF527_12015, partial [Pyrinomonadaceae bacterium]
MMSILKRAVPFILTLLVGLAVGSGLNRRARHTATHGLAQTSCKMRQRQAIRLPPPHASFEGEVYTAGEVTRKVSINDKPEPLYTSEARRHNLTGTV